MTVSSGTCSVKKAGSQLVLEQPALTVQPEGADAFELGAKRFAQGFSATFKKDKPVAAATLGADDTVSAALDKSKYKKKNKKKPESLTFFVGQSDREALAAVDPTSDTCSLVFTTPCPNEDPEDPTGPCPESKPFLADRKCVAKCGKKRPVVDEGVCSKRCSTARPLLDESTCVASCPAAKAVVDDNICLAACPKKRPFSDRGKVSSAVRPRREAED